MDFNKAVCNTLDSLHVSKTYIGYDYIIYVLNYYMRIMIVLQVL